ncbi:leucine--tRNA ligase [candidate division KSB1 bacterium]
MASYDHEKIEKKWQKKWEYDGLYSTQDKVDGKENFLALIEYPYPSGNLHTGHWYAFSIPDMFARYKRMQGFNVMFPIGFDSFGLPAENAAIKNNVDPKEWTYQNIDTMTEQLKSMGAMFDWSRKVVASDEDYYKWTQWLFLQMYSKGLAHQKEATVNWDPIDQTVLANEQVGPDGIAERSGAVVEKKKLKQWFLKITDYADRLIEDLDELNWPEEIKQAQRAWIGRSEGAEIEFKVKSIKLKDELSIKVFTTRPDTLFGATYLVLAPEHELVEKFKDKIENWDKVVQYTRLTAKKSDLDRQKDEKEKTGVELKGVKAVNPANNEEIPIYIADYVLAGYGTGAIMAVPAHDLRDKQFAEAHGLEVRVVIKGEESPFKGTLNKERDNSFKQNITASSEIHNDVYSGEGVLVNSGEFDGLTSEEVKEKITKKVCGEMKATYRLRDWLISRQRYWGCPIPIVYDPEGKAHAIPDEHLPWTLPTDVDFKPSGVAPLARSKELKERTEKIFGEGWTPECDTMDTFVDSSWYFLRYTDPKNDKEFASKNKLKTWMPVDRYSGGAEHTTMHLLYSRFFQKALHDLGLVEDSEPYKERYNRGLILGTDGRKMSKRWGNVIDPDEHVKNVGADVVRMYLAFIGPYIIPGNYPWDLGGLVGVRRFLEKIVDASEKSIENVSEQTSKEVSFELNKTIKKVGEDIESYKFNTAISQLMILLNTVNEGSISKNDMETVLKLVSPLAPHLSEELWEKMGNTASVHLEGWPEYDESKLVSDTVSVVVQINGKTRGSVESPSGSGEDEILALIRGDDSFSKWIKGDLRKVIYVENKLINLVL